MLAVLGLCALVAQQCRASGVMTPKVAGSSPAQRAAGGSVRGPAPLPPGDQHELVHTHTTLDLTCRLIGFSVLPSVRQEHAMRPGDDRDPLLDLIKPEGPT